MIYLLIGYMWLFIHRPFEVWPGLLAIRIERTYMIFVIICWLASGPKLPKWNRLHAYFSFFVLVVIASWLVSPYRAICQGGVQNYLKLVVFYVLLVTSVRDKRHLRMIVIGLVCIMALFMAHSMREWFCGRMFYKQGISRLQGVGVTFSDQNDFAGLIVMSLPFAWVLWREWTSGWKRLAVVGHFGLAAWCIVRTGSRMGFCGLLLAGFIAAMASPRRWRMLALAPLLLAGAWMLVPEAQQNRYLTLIDPSYDTRAGDPSRYRYGGFETGLQLCAERPLLGFGPGTTGVALGTGRAPHNTYGQVLGELGIAGAVALGLIILGVAQNFLEARRAFRRLDVTDDLLPWRTAVAASAAFVLLIVMGWGLHFAYWHVWLWFGALQATALQCLKAQAESRLEVAECDVAEETAIPTLA